MSYPALSTQGRCSPLCRRPSAAAEAAATPVPADAASVERMVEQANYGIIGLTDTGKPWTSYDAARAALAAIGIGGAK